MEKVNYLRGIKKALRQEAPQSQYLLAHYLDALKYLPQEYIRSLVRDNPDGYIISFANGSVPDDNQTLVKFVQ